MSHPTVETAGWHAALELKFQSVDGRTCLTHRRHSGPLLVQRAFYPERDSALRAPSPAGPLGTAEVPGLTEKPRAGEPCHLYILHPPGGIASGDHLALQASIGPGAHALLTTPAAGKFYRRGAGGTARLTQALTAQAGLLEWLPQENIFYPDAAVELSSIVRLSRGARFIGWEISCLGLPALGQTLQSGEIRQRVELWADERPLLLERQTLGSSGLCARWGLAGRIALGTWLAFPATSSELERAREATAHACAGLTVACTLVDEVLVCRACGIRTDRLREVFTGLWRALRPALMGRDAVPPRVWAT
jgi:urease accessory protein